jgi:hypothetical protein
MIGMIRNAPAALAIAGLAIAQPALATRSAESLPAASAAVTAPSAHRIGSKVGTAEDLHGTNGFVIGGITIFALVAIILALTYNHHDGNKSPG